MACIGPRAILPGISTEFSFLRDGMVGPSESAGSDIKCMNIASECFLIRKRVGHRLPDYHDIPDHHGNAAPAESLKFNREKLQIDATVNAKIVKCRAICGIQGIQKRTTLHEQTLFISFTPVRSTTC